MSKYNIQTHLLKIFRFDVLGLLNLVKAVEPLRAAIAHIEKGEKVKAVKILREETGLGLQEVAHAVDLYIINEFQEGKLHDVYKNSKFHSSLYNRWAISTTEVRGRNQ